MILVSVVVGVGYFGIHVVLFSPYLLRMGYGPGSFEIFNGVAGRRWGTRGTMLTAYSIWCVGNVPLPQAELVPVVAVSRSVRGHGRRT